ncbi:MAG: VCBS repeat-containing protein [Syntrophobacterales bacterium]|nr:VCBS repeat-containing protein [Syntrophobacterales bacterium]
MRTFKRKSILLALLLLGLCTACGGGGGGDVIPPFTMNDAVATGDLNGDGKLDLALATTYVAGPPPHPGHVVVYLQDPALFGLSFSAVEYSVGSDPWHIAVADLNSDGKLDLVTANTSSNDVSVLLQDTTASGSFQAAVNHATGVYTNFVAVGDLNDDGRPDIAAATNEGISILLQNPAQPGGFLTSIRLALPSGVSSTAIADLNGDGKADLAATSSDKIYIFTQDPAAPGTFLPAVSYAAGPRASFVVTQDIDGDGLPDLAVANAGGSSDGGNSSIAIRLQDRLNPGQFLAVQNYASANGSRSLAVGDFNGDGRPDLALAAVVYSSQSPGIVQVFIQDAAKPGAFLLPQNYGGGYTPHSIAGGDFNGDGKLDLVSNDGPLLFLQNSAQPGQFAEGVIVPLR